MDPVHLCKKILHLEKLKSIEIFIFSVEILSKNLLFKDTQYISKDIDRYDVIWEICVKLLSRIRLTQNFGIFLEFKDI